MDVAWGDAAEDSTAGLDIAGVRGLDQQMEASLVNGITTVSQRGRYITILPWAVAEFFSSESAAGEASYSQDRFAAFLRRIEFLVLACTTVDAGEGASGAIGRQTFESQMEALAAGEVVSFPATGGGAMLGTYFGPCRAVGLLTNPPAGSAVPIAVTTRGSAVWEIRRKALNGTAWRAVASAEGIGREDARALAAHFSLKSLTTSPNERAALQSALLEPWHPHEGPGRVADAYCRFAQTVDWLRAGSGPGPIRADALLAAAWRRAATGASADLVDLAWAEYEWRCRLHFAIELMLSAVSAAVDAQGEATVSELIAAWLAEADLPARLVVAWPRAGEAGAMSGVDARGSVPPELWLGEAIPSDLGSLRPHARALAAFALVAALAAQSADLRATGRFADRQAVGERALACVAAADIRPFAETLKSLAAVAIEAHLATTFRKMGGRQKCSLRFFPEGPKLLATRRPTSPGRSGTRLWNAIKMLQDAGVPGLGAVS
ncbi:hypothetical protein ACYQR9_15680 [Methylobacterium sp. CM6241]